MPAKPDVWQKDTGGNIGEWYSRSWTFSDPKWLQNCCPQVIWGTFWGDPSPCEAVIHPNCPKISENLLLHLNPGNPRFRCDLMTLPFLHFFRKGLKTAFFTDFRRRPALTSPFLETGSWFLVWTSPIGGALRIKTLAEIRWLCLFFVFWENKCP